MRTLVVFAGLAALALLIGWRLGDSWAGVVLVLAALKMSAGGERRAYYDPVLGEHFYGDPPGSSLERR